MIAVLWVQDEVSAAAVARMVDMSLEEVADLLGGAAASGPGDTDTALLAREAAQVLLQLEAAICSGQSCHLCSQQVLTIGALHVSNRLY
jgi:hypothetical protein